MKHLKLLLVPAALIGLSGCVTPSATPSPSPVPTASPTVPLAAALDCGTIQMRGPNPPAGSAAQQSEDCFWNAFQQKKPAKLVVSIMGVDTVETHTLALDIESGNLVVADTVSRTIVPARTMPTETHTCATVEQQQGGLVLKSCGDEGDFLVPAPAK